MTRGRRARSLQRASWAWLILTLACDDAVSDAPNPRDTGSDSDVSDAAHGGDEAWTAPIVQYPDSKSAETFLLSQAGLYRDIAAKDVAPDLIEFEPSYKLWSDGADKKRWLRLPPGTKIDTSDMDHWVFPIGTMLFKEFKRQGKLLETRLVARLGPEPDDYFMGAFEWNDDESDAVFVRDGDNDVRETDHDIPAVKKCFTCHNGERGRVLGYSAVQQPEAKAPLSDPPADPYLVPGDGIAREALGYLHANCGNCHNAHGTSRTDTNLTLRLEVTEHAVEETGIYQTGFRIDLDRWLHNGFDVRIAPGDPDRSAVLARMKTRTKDDAMPPFASEQVDPGGVELVRKWIASLPPVGN